MTEQELRDTFAVAAYPAAFQNAIKPYGHICDAVIEAAIKSAYWSADLAMQHRSKLKEPTTPTRVDGGEV